MRVSLIKSGVVVNIIEAESVAFAAELFPDFRCRRARADDVIAQAPLTKAQRIEAALSAEFEARKAAAARAELEAFAATDPVAQAIVKGIEGEDAAPVAP